MIKKIALAFGLLIAAILVAGALQPADYVVTRSTTIKAPAEKIFPYLNNQKLAERWGPWKETDPQATMSYSGPDEGVGAVASWDSPGQLGTGSATITETEPNQRVRIALAYTRPMNMTQTSDYIVEPNGDETKVTWRVEGKNSLPGRVMCLFMNMDKMVGTMFEKGLSNLKSLVEGTGS
ncbi:MAG: SRPBCC family protein [Bdellovibrionota bacterium]